MKKVCLIGIILIVFLFTACKNNASIDPNNQDVSNNNQTAEEIETDSEPIQQESPESEDRPLSNLPEEINTALSLKLLDSSSYGAGLTSGLKLTFEQAVSLEDLEKDLKLEPQVTYKIIEEDSRNYVIKPENEWFANTVYTLKYEPLDFAKAFQTIDRLTLVNSYPGNKASSVPVEAVVELYFNSETVTHIEEFFTIEPAVQGTFEYYDDKIVFIPQGLEENTDYTVTVKAGVSDDQRTLEESFDFSFRTRSNTSYNSLITQIINVKANDPFGIQLSSYGVEFSYLTKIYQVTDFDLYKDTYMSLKENHKYEVDFTKYPLVFDQEIATYTNNNIKLLQLPELEKGMYIVEIEEDNRYVFVQVNDYQVYNATLQEGNLYWVLDSEKDQGQENARVYLDDQLVGSTKADGVLVTESKAVNAMTYIDVAGEKFLLDTGRLPYYYGYYPDMETSDYWSFIYTDRSVYQSTDTVNLYAFFRSYTDKAMGKIELKVGTYWGDTYFYEKEVTVDDSMTLTESIDLKGLDYGYYVIRLFNDGQEIDYKEFSIRDYEKPELELTSSIDEKLVFSGDPIHYALKAQYFNGLPYVDYSIDMSYSANYSRIKTDSIKTDAEGMIILDEEALVDSTGWRPVNYMISASDKNGANGYNYTNAYVSVLPHKIMLQSQYDVEDKQASINLELNHIDITDFTGDYGTNYTNIKGERYDQTIRVDIIDHYVEKTLIETVYNPLHKISVDIYDYEIKEVRLDSRSIETVNGLANIDFQMEEDHRYEFQFNVMTPDGKTVIEKLYVGNHPYHYSNIMQPFSYAYKDQAYDIGDIVEFQLLREDYTPAIDQDNDLALNLILRNGLMSYEVTDQTKYSFEFKKEHRPNVLFKSVYFDGDMLYIVPANSSMSVNYDYQTLEYEIKTETDKIYYKPGEEVTLKVDVKNPAGQTFTGKMNLSVVDEAYFSLYEDYQEIGRLLHRFSYESGIIKESVSSVALDPFGYGAEAGEGGDDDYIRDDFKDTAIFKTIDIVDGKGTFTFNLPDDLTRWRLTLNAVNTDLEYASSKVNVNTILPYFIRNIYNKTYLVDDETFITLSSDGRALKDDSIVDYLVRLKRDQEERQDSAMQIGKDYAYLDIGKMTLGDYEITVTGSMGDYRDGIRETIEVVDSHLNFTHRQEGLLTESFKVTNPDEDTTIYIYNGQARQFLNDLYNVLSYSNDRLEEIISRHYVQKVIDTHFYDLEVEILDVKNFQSWDGGIKPLLTANTGVDTTAIIAGTGIGLEAFDQDQIIAYLKGVLLDESQSQINQLMALWGLANLDQPVLLGIDSILEIKTFDKMNDTEKLYTIYTLLDLGDTTRARNYAIQFFTNYEDSNMTKQEKLLAGTLAKRMDFDDDLYYELIETHDLKDDSLGLHKLYYMSYRDMTFKEPTFTYRLNNSQHEIALDNAKSYKLVVEAGDDLIIQEADEQILYSEMFRITGKNIEGFESDQLTIERSYDKSQVAINDLIKVTIKFTKPTDQFVTIRDVIPSGFTYAGMANYVSSYWLNNTQQNVRIRYYNRSSSDQITYYIKALQPGKYKAEPASVQMYYEGALEATPVEYLEVIHD